MRVLVYDKTQGFLSFLWSLGQYFSKFDLVIPARNWADVIYALEMADDVEELQFWGHGTSGGAFINGSPTTKQILTSIGLAGNFRASPRSFIWWRACSVFSRQIGANFAASAVKATGCSHVGHTRIVSAPWPMFQSGGYGLRVGEEVWWDPDEGLNKLGECKGSHPFVKNTIFVLKMSVPSHWWFGH